MLKQWKKRLMSLFAAGVFALGGGVPALREAGVRFDIPVFAADIVDSGKCGEHATWTLDSEGTLTISGTGEMSNYGDISSYSPWYNKRENVKKAVIHKGVKFIGDHVFYGCSKLTSISIPDSVTGIGNGSFASCSNIKSINIPKSVTSICNCAFEYCTSLTSITIPDSVNSIGDSAFYKCTSLTSIDIPNSVTSIGKSAFCYCYRLSSITIPNSITSIGDETFYYCTNLESITIPNSVMSIGKSTFSCCSNLPQITIPNSVMSIDEQAFSGCTKLTSITIPDSVTSIGSFAFSGCTSLTSINIPDGISRIPDRIFKSCRSLTNITIPDSVTVIGFGAFYECTSLKNINIPYNVTALEDYAFSNCTSLTSITIPDTVTKIGISALGYKYGEKVDGFKIYCYPGTAGEQYAVNKGFDYELLEPDENIYYPLRNDVAIEGPGILVLKVFAQHYLELKGDIHLISTKGNITKDYIIPKKYISIFKDEEGYICLRCEKLFFESGTRYNVVFDKGALLIDGNEFEPLTSKGYWSFKTNDNDSQNINISKSILGLDNLWTFENSNVINDFGEIKYEHYIKFFYPAQAASWLEYDNGKNGLCFGLVRAAIVSNKLGFMNADSFILADGKISRNLREIVDTDTSNKQYDLTVRDYIKYAHAYQYIPEIVEQYHNTSRDLNKIFKAINDSVNGSGKYIQIAVRGKGTDGKERGHAILPVGIGEDNDSYSEIIVYDCNDPCYLRKLLLYKNPFDKTKYIKWYYQMTDGREWGSDYEKERIEFCEIDRSFIDAIKSEGPIIKPIYDGLKIILSIDEINEQTNEELFNHLQEIYSSDSETESTSDKSSFAYWAKTDDNIIIQNSEKENEITVASSIESIRTHIPANAKLSVNVNDNGDDLAKVENIPAGNTSQIDFVSYKDSTETEAITDKVQITASGGETITATNHDGYVEVKGAKEFDIVTTDNDKVVDTKHIVADEHGVKVEINDDATIKDTAVDTNDDGKYDSKDSSTVITVTPKFDGKETKTYTDITLTVCGKTFTADSTGKITITGLADGTYEAVISKPNYAPVNVTITVGGENADVTIYKYGDADKNGKVDQSDLALLQKYSAGWNVTVDKPITDVTLDGKVNGEDIALIQKYFAGWNVTLGKAS